MHTQNHSPAFETGKPNNGLPTTIIFIKANGIYSALKILHVGGKFCFFFVEDLESPGNIPSFLLYRQSPYRGRICTQSPFFSSSLERNTKIREKIDKMTLSLSVLSHRIIFIQDVDFLYSRETMMKNAVPEINRWTCIFLLLSNQWGGGRGEKCRKTLVR